MRVGETDESCGQNEIVLGSGGWGEGGLNCTVAKFHSPQKEQGLEYAWNTVAIILFQALLGLQTQEALGPP